MNKANGMAAVAVFVSSLLAAGAVHASDTVIKGTGSTNATNSLEVTNSSDASLLLVRNDGNVGIGDTSPAGLLTVGSGDKFQVDSSGNTTLATQADLRLQDDTGGEYVAFQATAGTTTHTMSWPVNNASGVLTNNGSGTLTWAAGSGTAWDTIGDPSGGGSIAMGATAQTMDWATLNTQAGLTLNANALTTGELLTLAHTTSVIADGGSLLKISSTSADTGGATAGTLLDLTGNGSTGANLARISSDSLTNGSLLELVITGTAAIDNQTGITVDLSGTNSNSNQTTYAGYFFNNHGGVGATNIAVYASSPGGANQYAIVVPSGGGNVGIADSSPTALLTLGAGAATVPPIELTAGTNMTTITDGAIEMDADAIYAATDAGNRGYVPVRHFIRADSDRTLPNDTAANPVFNSPSNGRITLETGTYYFKFLYYITSMSATSGNAQILFGGSGTFSNWLWYLTGLDGGAVGSTALDDDTAIFQTNASFGSAVVAAVNTTMRVHGEGTFECTAGGTFIPQIDQVTAAAAVVESGSYFMIERIGSTSVASVGQWD